MGGNFHDLPIGSCVSNGYSSHKWVLGWISSVGSGISIYCISKFIKKMYLLIGSNILKSPSTINASSALICFPPSWRFSTLSGNCKWWRQSKREIDFFIIVNVLLHQVKHSVWAALACQPHVASINHVTRIPRWRSLMRSPWTDRGSRDTLIGRAHVEVIVFN